jgi:hypothetical protein
MQGPHTNRRKGLYFMKKHVALLIGLFLTLTASATMAADANPWCEIKHHVCEKDPSYISCFNAYQNCPNG